jgi:hypothetical protein
MSPSDATESPARDVRGRGDVILAHDAQIGHRDVQDERGRAFETLVLLLPELRASGFRFVPGTELLAEARR